MAYLKKVGTRITGDTDEHIVHEGTCLLYGIVPEEVTANTITVRDASVIGGSNVLHICDPGLSQVGKWFGGVLMQSGLSIQLADNTDAMIVIWAAV